MGGRGLGQVGVLNSNRLVQDAVIEFMAWHINMGNAEGIKHFFK